MKSTVAQRTPFDLGIANWENEGGATLPDCMEEAMRDPADADHILPRLGLIVVAHWKHLPRPVQKMIFDDLGLTISSAEARDLKERVAKFLHDRGHGLQPPYPVRPWPLGTLSL